MEFLHDHEPRSRYYRSRVPLLVLLLAGLICADTQAQESSGIVHFPTRERSWDRIPSITILTAANDSRIPLVLEAAELENTITSIDHTLTAFTNQVNRVARQLRTEVRLDSQVNVPSAAGNCHDLTDNFPQLSATLTNPARAIAEGATAVTKGDLT